MIIKKFVKTGNSKAIVFDQVLIEQMHANEDTSFAILPVGNDKGYYILPLTDENKNIETAVEIKIPVNIIRLALVELSQVQEPEKPP